MKSKLSLIIIIILTAIYWLFNPSFEIPNIETTKNIEKPLVVDSTITVSFSAVGDIMCHSTQYNYAWVMEDSFDFNPMFSVIGDYLREKDILIGNLETVLAGETKKYSGYPYFNTPNSFAKSLKYAGFDFLTTANNHANDQGFAGVKRTIDELRKINIIPLGTTKLDSSTNYNLFVRKGLRFGLLSYTYGTNYFEESLDPKKYVNHIHYTNIEKDIKILKKRNADVIIVLFHFGNQYEKNISKYQKKVVDKTIEFGADVILGSHPHIIQKFENFVSRSDKLDSGFVVYSLGNFVSNQRWRYSDGGIIFNFDITKNIYTDSIYISEKSFLPVWVFKGNTDRGRDFIILPASDSEINYDYLTESDIDSMKKSYFDSINQLTSSSSDVNLTKFNTKAK